MFIVDPVVTGYFEDFQSGYEGVEVSLGGYGVLDVDGGGVRSKADEGGAVMVNVFGLSEVQRPVFTAQGNEPLLAAFDFDP